MDLDLEVYFLNRFGEVIKTISPKASRTAPGITLSIDSKSGDRLGDDERCVVEVAKLPNNIHAAVIAINIPNARGGGFREVRNTSVVLNLFTAVVWIQY